MADKRRAKRNDKDKDAQKYHPNAGEVVHADVLRSFSDPGGDRYRARSARKAIEGFLGERAKDLKVSRLDVREESADEGVNTLRIRYAQYLNGLPVLGAGIHASADLARASVTRVENTVDDDVVDAPDPADAKSLEVVTPAVLKPFETEFGSAQLAGATLSYLRDLERPAVPEKDYPTASVELLSTGVRPDGRLHLVYDARVETSEPFEQFRVVVDAISGRVRFIELVGKYVAATGQVFLPDPVSESDSGTLSSTSTAATLDPFRHTVTMEVNAASGGFFRLEGDWFRCVDWDAPTFAVPAEAAANFSYKTYPSDRRFLNVNAYHWLDSFARYLRILANPTLNAAMARVDVDAQGFSGADNSQWVPGTPNRIRFGEGGVPDAADFGVVIHEYLHGVFQFLGSSHGGSGSYEHSFCDAIAAIYRDQHNPAQHRRAETFPFDNNATNRWSTERTLDRPERFDDAGFAGYGSDLRNSMLGTAIWQSYLGVGGDSGDAGVRQRASDTIIRTFLEMLLNVPDDSSTAASHAVSLAQGMIDADVTLTGGLHSKVIDAACVARGLWAARAVDLYISDSPADIGAIPSPIPHWTSPDIWVRNLGPADGDDPSLGHQEPIIGQPNYMYVTVHNRGTSPSAGGAFTVEAFHCDPGTGMTWPTDFTSMASLTIPTAIPPGGSVRVGPMLWTPAVISHECLLAIVHGAADPAVTAALIGTVPHDQLVRFDNNVGQRNVNPVMSVPGGKTKASMTMHGGLQPTANTLELDATAMPADTSIEVRTLTRLIDLSTLSGIAVTKPGAVKATMTMAGGVDASMAAFPLATGEDAVVDLVIDFSHTATHMETYPLIVTQHQDGRVVGRVTIDIVAVKELEDFFFGNPRSGEIHVTTCPFWPRLGPWSKRPFVRIEDAQARGYNGCAFCLPAFNTG
jgi:hypothetical protein